jgi:hypothetical protein
MRCCGREEGARPSRSTTTTTTATNNESAPRGALVVVGVTGGPARRQTVKDSPQEQLFTSLGFFSTKPDFMRLSCHSRTEPPR